MTLLDTILQSISLSIFSNVLAQLISAYQAGKDLFSLSNIDTQPIAHFVIYTIINVPINVLWQDWLEFQFPGSKPAPATAELKEKKPVGNKELDLKNTLIKFTLDQTVGASFNIPLFLAVIGLCRGQNQDQILSAIQNESFGIFKAGLKLWPAVSIVNFAAVPVENRVLVGSLAGVVWNIYLSLRA